MKKETLYDATQRGLFKIGEDPLPNVLYNFSLSLSLQIPSVISTYKLSSGHNDNIFIQV
jgi:hypothetical protein